MPIDSKEDRKFLEQAQLEYRVGQMLNHPNLVKIHVFEQSRDWLWRVKKVQLLIEYVNGKTLDKTPRLSVARLVQIFAKIAAGLNHMHRRGVCHADLKPNNILLSRVGDVKIIDYGLAWIKGEAKGRVQGTPEYMAPEQARQGTVNEQSDVYNFGATMYRLVTWRHPPSTVPSCRHDVKQQNLQGAASAGRGTGAANAEGTRRAYSPLPGVQRPRIGPRDQ